MDFQKLKQFMDRLTEEKVPGNAICVYQDGKRVFDYASGYADLETHTPMTGRELLNIYSCSKLTTVTAALQLYEQGVFLLTDPLSEYMPEFRQMDVCTEDGHCEKAKNPITIGNLFSMTAGFNYDIGLLNTEELREQTGGRFDTETVVRSLAKQPLCFEPGTRWQYSLCHDVLAGLVCVLTGKPFRVYVQDNVFDPLDMKETYYHRTPEVESRMASQYTFVEEGGELADAVEAQRAGGTNNGYFKKVDKSVGNFVPGCEYDSGGAGIVTAVPDYAKLLAALANGGLGLTGQRILSDATVRLMKTNHLTAQTAPSFNWDHLAGYGYGLGVRTMIDPVRGGSNSSIGEIGWGGAAGATAIVDTSRRLAVFYSHHMLNPQEGYYQPRLRNVVYSCLEG